MDDFLHEILENTKKMFPGATSVRIIVTNEDVKATASYNGELSDYSMKRLTDRGVVSAHNDLFSRCYYGRN